MEGVGREKGGGKRVGEVCRTKFTAGVWRTKFSFTEALEVIFYSKSNVSFCLLQLNISFLRKCDKEV